jgi:hypothetical protein
MADNSSALTAAPSSHGMGRWDAALFSKWVIHSEDLVIRGGSFGLAMPGFGDSLRLDGWFILWALIRTGITTDRNALPMNDG